MSNEYFTQPPDLAAETKARSVDINTLAAAVQTAFDRVPGRTAIYTDNLNYGVDTGVADAMVVSVNSAVVALVDGQEVRVKVAHANATTTPNINVNALGAIIVTRNDGTAVAPADIPAGIVAFSYNATTGRWTISAPGTQGTQGPAGPTGTKGADIASASTINLTTATGDFVHVTGTTTITAITLAVGVERTVIFDGALTLTHGAALLLPGTSNITTAANDRMKVRGDTAGAIVISYDRADGTAVKAGMVLLATITPTAAATIDFLSTFTSSCDTYRIIGEGLLPASIDGTLLCRLANAGSADTASNYAGATVGSSSTTTGTSISISSNVLTSGQGCNFVLDVVNTNDATRGKNVQGIGIAQSQVTPAWTAIEPRCFYTNAAVVSGLRFYWSSGANFSAVGKIRIYGYNNT